MPIDNNQHANCQLMTCRRQSYHRMQMGAQYSPFLYRHLHIHYIYLYRSLIHIQTSHPASNTSTLFRYQLFQNQNSISQQKNVLATVFVRVATTQQQGATTLPNSLSQRVNKYKAPDRLLHVMDDQNIEYFNQNFLNIQSIWIIYQTRVSGGGGALVTP